MDNSITSLKVETMKPFLFKAGITLTLSLAAFAYARIVAKRSNVGHSSVSETNLDSLETDSQFSRDDDSLHSLSSSTCFASPTCADLEEELSLLKDRIESLQRREQDLETRFFRYIDLKEKECVLTRMGDVMKLEIDRFGLLDKEISLTEEEIRRIEKFVSDYSRISDELKYWKSETGLLRKQVKRLLCKKRVQSRLLHETNSKLRAKDSEILRARQALRTSNDAVEMLENELSEMRIVLDQLQGEKNELLNKIVESEEINIAEHSRLANEVTELKMERESEVREVIYLRWINACLKHQLMKIEGQDWEDNWEMGVQEEHDCIDGIAELGHNGDYQNGDHHQACSKRKKLIKKLRRWVEGKENGKIGCGDEIETGRESKEVTCFGRHSF